MRRAVAVQVLVFMAVAVGCRSGSDTSEYADGQIHLTYWSSQNPQERQLAKRLVEKWNQTHPQIHVELQPIPAGQSSEEVLLAAIVAGTTPDLCSNIWPGIVGTFVEAGAVVALDRFEDFDSLMHSRMPPQLGERFQSVDGHTYQIPWKTNPVMMLYNKKLLREAGFKQAPRTYREFTAAAERISQDLDGDGHFDRWMGYRDIRPIWWQRYFDYYPLYLAASGGQTFFRAETLNIDVEASRAVFSFFQTLYDRDFFPVTTFAGNPFAAGKVATSFTGPWSIAWLRENAPVSLEYGYAPVPVPNQHTGPVFTYGDYKNIVIFSSTEHPQAAWKFAKYMVTRQADLKLLQIARQIPLRRNLLTDSLYANFFARHPKIIPFAQQAPRTRGVDDIASLPEMLNVVAHQYEAAAVYGIRSPREATTRMIERIRVIHQWSR